MLDGFGCRLRGLIKSWFAVLSMETIQTKFESRFMYHWLSNGPLPLLRVVLDLDLDLESDLE